MKLKKKKKSYVNVNVNVVGEKKIIFTENPKAVGEIKSLTVLI